MLITEHIPAALKGLREYVDTLDEIKARGWIEDHFDMECGIEINSCGSFCCVFGAYGLFAWDPASARFKDRRLPRAWFAGPRNAGVRWAENGVAAPVSGAFMRMNRGGYEGWLSDSLLECFQQHLFGSDHGSGMEAWTKMRKRAMWYIRRMERTLDYERIQALPKRERRVELDEWRAAA